MTTHRDADQVRDALGWLLPELAGATVRWAGAGVCCEAWWVAERYVVRFAKPGAGQQTSAALEAEMAVLPILADAIDVAIPRPLRLGRDPSTGWAVLVHEAVHGTPLLPEVWSSLEPEQRRSLASEVGTFVRQLQAVSIASAPVTLPETRFNGGQRDPESIERAVFVRMPPADAAACRALAGVFEPCSPNDWVFVHGDLYDHHLLIADNGSLAGVIDFGDLGLGDRDCDLGTLMDDFGIDFVADVLRDQPRAVARRRLGRARFLCVWEALVWAAEEVAAGRLDGMAEHLDRVEALARARVEP